MRKTEAQNGKHSYKHRKTCMTLNLVLFLLPHACFKFLLFYKFPGFIISDL